MSDGQLQLKISSGYHITRPQRRIEGIEDTFENVDVVFAEAPRANSPGWRSAVANLVTMPVLVATMYLWVAILTVWGLLTGKDDKQIVAHLDETHDAEVVLTDRNVHRLLGEDRFVWSIGHSIVLLLTGLAIPEFISTTSLFTALPVQLFTLFLLAGSGLFALFLAGTLHARNLHIVRDIEDYAIGNDASTACLITGGHHAPGVRTALKESDHVHVLKETDQ